jgi:LysM repeat protein
MQISQKLKLSSIVLLSVFGSAVCSSGYITPGSVAATADAENNPPATAFYIAPTSTAKLSSSVGEASPTAEVTGSPAASAEAGEAILYAAQSGDSLSVVAAHFGVEESEIASPADIADGLISPGQLLVVPDRLGEVSSNVQIMPDSEIIYSPSAIGFDAESYAGIPLGYLSSYREYLVPEWHNGGNVIEKIAIENSINPRILLSILEFQSNWVLGHPANAGVNLYPIGTEDDMDTGLYAQMVWVSNQLSTGYYGWREGSLNEYLFVDGTRMRISPELNAGSVAVQYLFSKLYAYEAWLEVIDESEGFPAMHKSMFPDPWVRAAQEEPLFTADLTQPELTLPFFGGQLWSFSSGPHGAWDRSGAQAALDFAPSSSEPGCVESDQSITAVAGGLVVRTAPGVVVLDLDGDGNEQTGWVILYLHVSSDKQVEDGSWVDRGSFLGFPSCEGGFSTASHLHIARKYNGEWMSAAGALPFELSGWRTEAGSAAYQGFLVRDGQTRTACTCGNPETLISLSSEDPY